MSIKDSNPGLDANGYWSHPKTNWEDWNRKNKCKLWEAVLLACNVDPAIYGLHGLTADFEADSYLTPVPADVRSLLSYVKIAVVNVDLRPVKRDPSNLMQSEIDMADFTAWLRTQGHQTPDGYPWIASELIPGKYQWPWGTYQTKDLELLAKAADKFWKNYDPTDHSTAATNETVIDWLIQQGMSKRKAEIVASILRDEDLPTVSR